MFKYQYWNDDRGWVINNKHSQDYGKANENTSYKPSDVELDFDDSFTKEQNATFSTTHPLPYSVKVHIDIPSWLWYHPLAKAYKAPSSSNLDCLTHPCVKVDFKKSGSGWGGVNAIKEERFKETNRTIKINASNDLNGSKSQVKKINW